MVQILPARDASDAPTSSRRKQPCQAIRVNAGTAPFLLPSRGDFTVPGNIAMSAVEGGQTVTYNYHSESISALIAETQRNWFHTMILIPASPRSLSG